MVPVEIGIRAVVWLGSVPFTLFRCFISVYSSIFTFLIKIPSFCSCTITLDGLSNPYFLAISIGIISAAKFATQKNVSHFFEF